ncbi:MAG: S-layer homology domain-containing protein, partial [Oscillospiraceae bacterium]|nr:S-layer homology domain-containing protein [Oscillospiraceae bacterium]
SAASVLYKRQALKGYDDGLFHPNNNVTVGELSVIIYRLATGEEPVGKKGYPDNAYSSLFGKSDHWAAYAIEALYSRETRYIHKMSDRANEPATRGDAISTVYTLAASLAGGGKNLTVVPEWE